MFWPSLHHAAEKAGTKAAARAEEADRASTSFSQISVPNLQAPAVLPGGLKIEAGSDSNGNSVLDPSEVTSVQYACNGTSGSADLVRTSEEPAGANCPNGGRKISAGVDTNQNGVLDPSEQHRSIMFATGQTVRAASTLLRLLFPSRPVPTALQAARR